MSDIVIVSKRYLKQDLEKMVKNKLEWVWTIWAIECMHLWKEIISSIIMSLPHPIERKTVLIL